MTSLLRPLAPDDIGAIIPEDDGVFYAFHDENKFREMRADVFKFDDELMAEDTQTVTLL